MLQEIFCWKNSHTLLLCCKQRLSFHQSSYPTAAMNMFYVKSEVEAAYIGRDQVILMLHRQVGTNRNYAILLCNGNTGKLFTNEMY